MTNLKNKKLPTISKIALKAFKPHCSEELSYFLAGLIYSDGCITQPGYVRIAFHVNEIAVAYCLIAVTYYLKAVIGYSTVTKDNNSLTARYTCKALAGLVKIASLISNKLKHNTKIHQLITWLTPKLSKKGHFCRATVNTPLALLNDD